MKVNGPGRMDPLNPYKRSAESQLKAQSKKDKVKDQVEISSQAQELLKSGGPITSAAVNGKEKLSVEQRERLAQLKEAVDQGTYQVDSRKLADKLYNYFFGPDGGVDK